LVGPIYHEERWSEYRNAAGFILPTLGEGLPTVLLEAAAHKLPVITTKEANFDELYESGGSILTSPNADDIEATLAEFFSLAGKDRKAIGLRGASLIEANFDWSTIASRWIAIYEELRTRERR
jgi:glycosyltransferase involved in cell wall biosynthesis